MRCSPRTSTAADSRGHPGRNCRRQWTTGCPAVSGCLLIALLLGIVAPAAAAEKKLTFDDRVEIVRGLMAEFATVKQFLPRSKKNLPFEATGTYDKALWEDRGKQYGPAARVGDLIQISKVEIEDDKIVLQINGGFRGGRRWFENLEVGMGGSGRTYPVSQNGTAAPGGTTLEVLFHKPLQPMKAADVKKILAPVLDFERRSATQLYSETLPAPIQKAIKEKKVLEGMDREQVLLSLGRPVRKSRETKDDVELEDWVYGQAPGKITFVTFNGDKVIKVKEAYAGLGAEAAKPLPPAY